MQTDPTVSNALQRIRTELIENHDESISPDVLAWGILALDISGSTAESLAPLRSRLIDSQWGDGRFSMSKDSPLSFWPTPIALLGLLRSSDFKENKTKALEFLLRVSGLHWKRSPGDPAKHDTSLLGWPWIGATHSWVIPTAITITTLRAYGFEKHARVTTGVQMILDRQLSTGGWNYGNTIVFNSELRPFPECTGYALNALHGLVSEEKIAQSLTYLIGRMGVIRTPISLSWTALGLGAWSRRPPETEVWIAETLKKQELYGEYPVNLLSQLVIGYYSKNGYYS
jgi:hypothetical protein